MNEILISILYTVASLFEIIPAFYVLIADRRSPGNRALALFFTILALNSLAFGTLLGVFSLNEALPWIAVFVSTTYMIGPATYLAGVAVLRPRWLRHWWLFYPVYILLALPAVLVLSDVTGLTSLFVQGPLIFSPPSAEIYAGGAIRLAEASSGLLSRPMLMAQIGFPLLALVCPMLVVGFRDWKRNPDLSRIGFLFFGATASAALSQTFADDLIGPVYAALISNFVFILAFGLASFRSSGIPWSLSTMRRSLDNWPIFTKLILVVLTVFIPAIILISLVSGSIVRANITNQTGTNFNALVRLEARSIGESLQAQVVSLDRLAQSPVLLATINAQVLPLRDFSDEDIRSWLIARESGWIESDLSMSEQVPPKFLTSIAVLNDFRENFPLFSYIQVTDLFGGLVTATSTPNHFDYSNAGWWKAAYDQGRGQTYISVPLLDPNTGQRYLEIAIPVRSSESGGVDGILFGRYEMGELVSILTTTQVGESGHSDLFGPSGIEIPLNEGADSHEEDSGEKVALNWNELLASPFPWEILPYEGVSSIVSWATVGDEMPEGSTLSELQWRIAIHQEVEEALAAIGAAQRATFLTTLITTLIGFAFAWLLSGFITQPLHSLTGVAQRVLEGDLNVRADIQGEDEIGILASTFNTMTEQLRDLVSGLESQVAARTADLEDQAQKLQAATQVGQGVTSILEVDELIQTCVTVIQERFDLYYVGLFLSDEERNWAVLRAGTGSAGETMLSRGHRIRVGEGMIGWSIENARARVAGDAAADIVRLLSPELPETRAEAAIPMRARGQTVGAISVQSLRPDEFDPSTVNILQTVADQIGIALDNANLLQANREALKESQQALETVRRTYQQVTREAWAETGLRQQWTLKATPGGVDWLSPGQEAPDGDDGDGSPEPGDMAVPIKVRDQTVGTIRLRKPAAALDWSDAEKKYIDSYVSQLGQALDSARLFQDIQSRSVQLQASAEVGRAATSILEQDRLLPEAVNLIGERFSLYYAGVFLLDESEKWAVLRAGSGEAGREQLEAGHRLEVGGQSMVGQCIASGEPRIALDVGEEAVRFENPVLPDTRTELAIPLVSAGQTIGAITIQSKRPAAFSSDDIVVFRTMADQLSTAIVNARLYDQSQKATLTAQEQRRIADALLKSSARFAETQEQDRIFQVIIEEIDEQIRPDQINIFTCTLPAEELDLARRYTPGDPEDGYEEGQVVLGSERPDLVRIIQKQDHLYDPDVRSDGLTHEQYRLPLLLANQAIGVIEVFHTAHDAHLRAEDRAVIDGIVQQAAVAMQSARAFEQTQEALARTEALYRVGQAALQAENLEQLLQAVTDTVADTLPADRANLLTIDRASESVTCCTQNGTEFGSIPIPAFKDLMSGLAGWVIREQKSTLSHRGQPDPREGIVIQRMRENMGDGSMIVAPLAVRDRVLGTIAVINRENGAEFNEQDMALLNALAVQTAVAVQNSELFAETQKTARNERLLNQIGSQLIQSLDVETILQTAVEEIGQLPNITNVTLTLGESKATNGDGTDGSVSRE